MSLELADKLYTSTQVADVLGVSLRTLYRYMEDGKIQSMRTASGRHRFTKDQILEFLHADSPRVVEPVANDSTIMGVNGSVQDSEKRVPPQPNMSQGENVNIRTPVGSEFEVPVGVKPTVGMTGMPVDPFAKSPQDVQDVKVSPVVADMESNLNTVTTTPIPERTEVTNNSFLHQERAVDTKESTAGMQSRTQPVMPTPQKDTVDVNFSGRAESFISNSDKAKVLETENIPSTRGTLRLFKSDYVDLIDLAKRIKDVAKVKDLEYAFTLFAGMSLHLPIKPFTNLHFYVNPEDIQIWKNELRMVPVEDAKSANVSLFINTDIVFVPTKEIGGFKVVTDKVLLKDLSDNGEKELFVQFRQHLTSS